MASTTATDLNLKALRELLAMARMALPVETQTSDFDDECDDIIMHVTHRGASGRARVWSPVAERVPKIITPLLVETLNALPALLDLADPETLRFVRVVGAMSSTSRAIAADGTIYVIYVAAGGEWGFDCGDLLRPVYPFATESEAIEAAREHDRARRGAK